MRLYLDDNSAGLVLTALLQKEGHTVVCPSDVNLKGVSDARHFAHAIRAGLVMLTADRVDFWQLHDLVQAAGGAHPGLLVVRYDNNPKRDMKPKHIVAALAKLERVGVDVANQVVVLNQWR